MQGRNVNILIGIDKIQEFVNKLNLLNQRIENGSKEMFLTVSPLADDTEMVINLILEHLGILQEKFKMHFGKPSRFRLGP